jgi:hypothetical protein
MRIKATKKTFVNIDDKEFLGKVMRGFMFSHGVYDKRGHTNEIRFRVQPGEKDLSASLFDKAPSGWFKSYSDLWRSIHVVGRMALLEVFKQEGIWDDELAELERVFEDIVAMEKGLRVSELYERIVESKRAELSKKNPNLEKLKQLNAVENRLDEITSSE